MRSHTFLLALHPLCAVLCALHRIATEHTPNVDLNSKHSYFSAQETLLTTAVVESFFRPSNKS